MCNTLTCTERKRLNSPSQPVGRWIRVEKRLAIYLRDGFRCVYCCCDLHGADPRDVTLGHCTAKVDGGTNHHSNLVTACRSCNSSRQDQKLSRFASVQARADIRRLTKRDLKPYVTLAKAMLADKAGDDSVESK